MLEKASSPKAEELNSYLALVALLRLECNVCKRKACMKPKMKNDCDISAKKLECAQKILAIKKLSR